MYFVCLFDFVYVIRVFELCGYCFVVGIVVCCVCDCCFFDCLFHLCFRSQGFVLLKCFFVFCTVAQVIVMPVTFVFLVFDYDVVFM